jgi:hypothetical protein
MAFRAKTTQSEFLALCSDLAHATQLRFSLPDTDTLRFTRWSRRRCCPGKNTQLFVGRARLGLEKPSPWLTSPPWPWAWESERSSRLFTEGRAAATCVATWVTHSSLLQPAKVRESQRTTSMELWWADKELTSKGISTKKWSPRGITHYFLLFSFVFFPWLVSAQNLITKYSKRRRSVSFRVSLSQALL